MERCRAAGGLTCRVAFTTTNASIAVARDEARGLLANFGSSPRAAKKRLLNDCKEQGIKCKIVEVIRSEPLRYYID